MLPVYAILNADPTVHSLLFDVQLSRIRAWGYGYADEAAVGVGPNVKPYVTWFEPSDEPENMLTCDPTHSHVIYQFDVYSRAGGTTREINSALQYTLRRHGPIEAIRHPVFNAETKLFHAGFDLHYIQMR